MLITLSAIRLRKLWYYFPLTYNAMFVVLQIRKQKGFILMKNTGFGYWHYTLSVWESEADMKAFSHTGRHKKAIQMGPKLATEVRLHTYRADKLPSWKEVREIMKSEGRVITYP